MINQIIFQKVNKRQLFVVALGGFTGFLFLLTVVHFFGVIQNLAPGDDSVGANLVIAQKKVTKYTAFDSKSNLFTESELKTISEHPAVKKMEPVVNNSFSISLAMKEEGLPYFRTDIFVQAVSNDLLDVQIDDWQWSENSEFVPLIMPRDFMLMLNQFAASYKIPQVSEDIAKTLNFTLEVRGKGQRKSYNARIVGFSNQMNAVLVPISYMDFGNSQFGTEDSHSVSQIVMRLDEKNYSDFEKLIDDMNLEIKENELLVVKIQSMLYVVLGALFFVALIIVVLCGLMVLQFSMLLISESAYEIQTLLRLGYHPKELAKLFYKYFLKRSLLLVLITIPAFLLLKYMVDQSMISFGLVVAKYPSVSGLVILILLSLAITIWNYYSVLKKMYRAF